MKKIKILSILALLFVCFDVYANNDIPLKDEDDDIRTLGGRSSIAVPTATLDGTTLTLTYPLATESQVMITDQSAQTVVYSETFTATRSLTIDLSDEGIEDGIYTLRVYAFGKWWIGEFELEDR